jgi:hypothetical protein
MMEWLRESSDPAIRRLAGDSGADVLASPRVQTLLDFPDAHPYEKWWGTHWRLVSLADLGVPPGTDSVAAGVEQELAWLTSDAHKSRIQRVNDLTRRCASQEGNAVYACSKLGFASDERVAGLAQSLLEWQWPDGGWNCDVKATGRRSSFHETVTPALGLAEYFNATNDTDARSGAERAAELLLEHRLFRSLSSGDAIHPSWVKLHYPPYWHYDILQGLRLLAELGLLRDPRAQDALDIVEASRRRDGKFSGPKWSSSLQPDPGDWGNGTANEMLNFRVGTVLRAAGRL